MADIRIDFLLGPSWTSRAIAWYGYGAQTKLGGVSHAASLLKDGRYLDARSETMFGVPPGVHIREVSTEPFVKKIRATFAGVTDEVYAAWEANLRAKITDGYDKKTIEGYILNKRLHGPHTYDCSALACNALQHVGIIPFPLVFPAHQISPNTLLLLCQTAKAVIAPVPL